jgi:hypothetical protein
MALQAKASDSAEFKPTRTAVGLRHNIFPKTNCTFEDQLLANAGAGHRHGIASTRSCIRNVHLLDIRRLHPLVVDLNFDLHSISWRQSFRRHLNIDLI